VTDLPLGDMAFDELPSDRRGKRPSPPELIDLSLPLRDGGPSYPGDPLCSIRPFKSLEADGVNLRTIAIGSHQGTHLDAASHFLADGTTVERIPLGQTTGPAILVDLGERPPRSAIEVADFSRLELQPGDRLVYRVGWDRRVEEPGYFTDGPRLSLDAARWLAERRLGLLGMDTPTPNPEHGREIHRLLLGAGTVLLEALAGLDRLRPGSFWLSAAPIRIVGSDGAPVRAYGLQRPAR
jgi:arylformamidase